MKKKYLAATALLLSAFTLLGAGSMSVASASGPISGNGPTSATVTSGQITLNSFGFGNNTTATSSQPQSLTGSSINVNNTANKPFFVWINVSDTAGYKSIVYIDAYLYYENSALTNTYNQSAGQNMNIYMNLTNLTSQGTTPYSVRMLWPAANNNPTAWLLGTGGYYKYVNTTTANFTFEFHLGSQIHNASTTNNNYAWAVNLTVSGGGSSLNTGKKYFGVNDYESVTIVQNQVSGSGAPSATAVYSLGSLKLDYSVNNNYVLSLEASNMTGKVGTVSYTFLRQNIGIYNGSYNGSSKPNAYYSSSTNTVLPSSISPTVNGAARPFNDTTGPSAGQVSLFGVANTSWAPAQQDGVWETITVEFVFQVPIGTVAAAYSGTIYWRLWAQDQTIPAI